MWPPTYMAVAQASRWPEPKHRREVTPPTAHLQRKWHKKARIYTNRPSRDPQVPGWGTSPRDQSVNHAMGSTRLANTADGSEHEHDNDPSTRTCCNT